MVSRFDYLLRDVDGSELQALGKFIAVFARFEHASASLAAAPGASSERAASVSASDFCEPSE
jgi:hypothetical protein